MTTLFSDGQVGSTMETAGNFSAWTGTNGTPAVQSTIKHHGTNGAYFNANNEYIYKTLDAQNIMYTCGYIYFNTLPGTGGKNFIFFGPGNSGFSYYAYAAISDNVFMLRTAEGGGATNTSSGITALAKTWHCIEVMRDITNDHAELWIDGISRATRDAAFSQANTTVPLGIATGVGTPVYDMYADCIVAADAYIGPEVTVKKSGNLSGMMTQMLQSKMLFSTCNPYTLRI